MSDFEKPTLSGMGGPPACPDCQTVTRAGTFTVGQSLTSRLFDGKAWPDLFFSPQGMSIWNREVVPLDQRSGWLCPRCGFVLIRGEVASQVEEGLRNREKISDDQQILPRLGDWKKP